MMTEKQEQQDQQWKHQGFCSLCRRRNYCKSECTAHRRNVLAKAEEIFIRRTGADRIREAMRAAKGE